MDGPRDRDAQRRGKPRATALEDAQVKLSASRLEQQPQLRWRRLLHHLRWTEEEREGCTGLGRQGKPPQLAVVRARQPHEQCPAGARA
jgi:hypothetical protein